MLFIVSDSLNLWASAHFAKFGILININFFEFDDDYSGAFLRYIIKVVKDFITNVDINKLL